MNENRDEVRAMAIKITNPVDEEKNKKVSAKILKGMFNQKLREIEDRINPTTLKRKIKTKLLKKVKKKPTADEAEAKALLLKQYKQVCNHCIKILDYNDELDRNIEFNKKFKVPLDIFFVTYKKDLARILPTIETTNNPELNKIIQDTFIYAIKDVNEKIVRLKIDGRVDSKFRILSDNKDTFLSNVLAEEKIASQIETAPAATQPSPYAKVPETILKKVPEPSSNQTIFDFSDMDVIYETNLPPPIITDTLPLDESVNLVKKIDSGHYGTVYAASVNPNFIDQFHNENLCGNETEKKQVVAVKMITGELNAEALLNFSRETAIGTQLRLKAIESSRQDDCYCAMQAPGIITSQEKTYPAIVSQFQGGGRVEDYLNAAVPKEKRAEATVAIMKKLMIAMNFMHDNNIIHRDISLRNILMSADQNPILSDFGFSSPIGRSKNAIFIAKDDIGPINWMAVQSLREREYSRATDHFAMKVTIFEILASAAGLKKGDIFPPDKSENTANAMWHYDVEDHGYLETLRMHLLTLLEAKNDIPSQQIHAVLNDKAFIAYITSTITDFSSQEDYLNQQTQLFNQSFESLELTIKDESKKMLNIYRQNILLNNNDPIKQETVAKLMLRYSLPDLKVLLEDQTFKTKFFNYIDEHLNNEKNNTIYQAILHDNIPFLKLLLESGYNVNQKNQYGATWLHFATAYGNDEIIKLLIDRGADIFAKDDPGINHSPMSPLEFSVAGRSKDQETIRQRFLPALVSTLTSTDEEKKKLLIEMLVKPQYLKLLTTVLQDNSAKESIFSYLDSHNKYTYGLSQNLEAMKLLINAGRDVNQLDTQKHSWLHYAVSWGDVNMVEMLLDHGADVNLDALKKINAPHKEHHKEIMTLLENHLNENREHAQPSVNSQEPVDLTALNIVMDTLMSSFNHLVAELKKTVEPSLPKGYKIGMFANFPIKTSPIENIPTRTPSLSVK